MEEIELELYLVRHGESMSNIGADGELSYELKSDSPLSPKGERQAELLGEYFSEYSLDYLMSSGLRRALQTAYQVGIHQPENGARKVEVHRIFTERNTECRSRSIEEIQQELPIMIPALGTKPEDGTVHQGGDDTDEMTFARAQEAVKYLRERFHNGEKVMVVAHAALITDMYLDMLGLDRIQKFDPSFYNTGITKIVFFREGTAPYADIYQVYHNAVPHLYAEMPEFRF
ncbi:MAG: histidine phosphatase family protein [Clostridia bacterium]|nr:histidine phosphatase family protein [Clostridia bacterium]